MIPDGNLDLQERRPSTGKTKDGGELERVTFPSLHFLETKDHLQLKITSG
jgi:hypothetical protein